MLGAAAMVFGVLALWSVPALAYSGVGTPGDPEPLSTIEFLLLFVFFPIGSFLVIAAFTLLPGSKVGALKYRPGRTWAFGPIWFGPAPAETQGLPTPMGGEGGASGSW